MAPEEETPHRPAYNYKLVTKDNEVYHETGYLTFNHLFISIMEDETGENLKLILPFDQMKSIQRLEQAPSGISLN